MSDRDIIFADVSTRERQDDYVRNSAEIPCNLHVEPDVQQVLSTPADPPTIPSYNEPQRARVRRVRSSERPKRHYTFVNQSLRDKLTELFAQHGTNKKASWYHKQTGIRLGTCQNMLTKLKKGGDLTLSTVKRGRRRILQEDHSIVITRTVRKHPETSLRELIKKVTKYEEKKDCTSDARNNVGNESLDSTHGEQEESDDIDSDDESGYTSGESTDIEPQELPDHAQAAAIPDGNEEEHNICSVSTMCRHLLHGITLHGFKPLTYKVMRLRSPRGNTPEVKDKRKQVASTIWRLHSEGVEIAFVDESHWEIGKRVQRGRSPKGEVALSTRSFQRTKLTCISMISSVGNTYNQVLKGPITSEVFEAFMRDLIAAHKRKTPTPLVIYMDNAPVHNQDNLKELIEGAGYAVVFGPKYSAEMNPIEFIFGVWKKEVNSAIQSQDLTETVLLNEIRKAFDTLTPTLLRKTVNHVFLKVYPKVFSDQDL